MVDAKHYRAPRTFEWPDVILIAVIFLVVGVLFGAQGARWEAGVRDDVEKIERASAAGGGYDIAKDTEAPGHAKRAARNYVRRVRP